MTRPRATGAAPKSAPAVFLAPLRLPYQARWAKLALLAKREKKIACATSAGGGRTKLNGVTPRFRDVVKLFFFQE